MSGAVGSKPCLTRSGRPSLAPRAQRSSNAPFGEDLLGPARQDARLALGCHGVLSRACIDRHRAERRHSKCAAADAATARATAQAFSRGEALTAFRGTLPRLRLAERTRTLNRAAAIEQPAVRAGVALSLEAVLRPRRDRRLRLGRRGVRRRRSGCGRDLPSPAAAHRDPAPVKTLGLRRARAACSTSSSRRTARRSRSQQIPRHLVNATIVDRGPQLLPALGRRPVGHRRARAMHRHPARCDAPRAAARSPSSSRATCSSRTSARCTRKLKEIALAIEIERNYSKDQILEMYFNQIYFGEGAYGVEAAAKTFFGKPLRELTLPECALLAGLPANPSLYSPRRRPTAARRAARKVLAQHARDQGASRRSSSTTRSSAPLGVTPQRYSNDRAPYFVEMVRLHLDETLRLERGLRGRPQRLHDARHGPAAGRRARAREAALRARERSSSSRTTRASYVAAGHGGGPAPRQTHALPPGRAGRDRPAHRLHPRAGRRPRLEPQQLQPRDAGAAPAGLGVQAVRLRRGDGQRIPPDRHHRRRAGLVPGRRTASSTSRGTTTTSSAAR